MSVPDGFFEPLPNELLNAFGATGDASEGSSSPVADAEHWTDHIYPFIDEP